MRVGRSHFSRCCYLIVGNALRRHDKTLRYSFFEFLLVRIARKHLGCEFFSRDLFESQLGSFNAAVIEMAHNNHGGITSLRHLEGKLYDLWVVGQFALGIVPSSAARAKILGTSSRFTERR